MSNKTGIELIAEERQRQIEVEGCTTEHDDSHGDGSLAMAASCYAVPSSLREYPTLATHPELWPWDTRWWKPTPNDRIRELVKAGALIAAEIERLQRMEKQKQ